MIDLSGIARHLRLSPDQIRVATDLLEQGYTPTFIARYRGDEIGALPTPTLWRLKFQVDRIKRLEAARARALRQLPKDSVLDSDAQQFLQSAGSLVAIDVVLRCFRARRSMAQSQERHGQASQLVESLLTHSGPPIDDLAAWAASQLGTEDADGQQLLSEAAKLVGLLVLGDTGLHHRLRQTIIRKAALRVVDPSPGHESEPPSSSTEGVATTLDESSVHEPIDAQSLEHDESHHDEVHAEEHGDEHFEGTEHEGAPVATSAAVEAEDTAAAGGTMGGDAVASQTSGSNKATAASKSHSKLTPRQRRRRWLVAVLAPLRTLKKPLCKLTAYQHLMLGRGIRSQLIGIALDYDPALLVEQARNSFADARHPLSGWFSEAVSRALDGGLRQRLESDALAELEEQASDSLLEHAADDLRRQLMRRPVRGHTVLLIDTVGPKTVAVVVVNPQGQVLACDELPCSAQPEIVSQNVVQLGELVHKHRVTLVALSNGPARRFMVASLRDFMAQSKDSGLRWTMADRSGAEAYASGRIGLQELSTCNRRHRAAIWTARCLQDPLVELLKVDFNRLRLGSFQRELPPEPVKQVVHDAIIDCICARGIDTHHAVENLLQFIPGIQASQAQQIARLASSGQLTDRKQLQEQIADWAESDRRQALGWLRVFDSPCTLDGTLIHPEDYRLAERLIENTDLCQPPAAPMGWTKPAALRADSPPTVSVPTSAAVASPPDTDAPREGAQTPLAEQAGESAPEPATAELQPSDDIQPEPVLEAAESLAADPADPLAATAEDVPPDVASAAGTSVASNTAEPSPTVAPEYPEQLAELSEAAPIVDAEKLAKQWQVGRVKLKSIAAALQDPFGDPRLANPPVPLLAELPTLDSLQPGDCVWAIVVGVADFGVFVEIGPNCNGLVHISRLSPHFIEDPHQCVQVGDLLMTWVVSIDQKKSRVALTCLSPRQRAEVQAAAEQRKIQETEERGQRGHGYRGAAGERPAGRQDRTQRGESASARSRGSTTEGHVRGGGGDRSRGSSRRGRGRGGDDSARSSKTVVVTSKQPKVPISQAMKEGEEPLRSFSDLLQFYEAKRAPTPSEAPRIDQRSTAQSPAEAPSEESPDRPHDQVVSAEQPSTSSGAPGDDDGQTAQPPA